MGDKTAARRAAIACNVPIVPGTNQALENVEEAKAFAEEVRGAAAAVSAVAAVVAVAALVAAATAA
jgi:acetyl/propionyl-CoA carboxylase alpha subunit